MPEVRMNRDPILRALSQSFIYDPMSPISVLLRKARTDRKLTQAQLARRASVTQPMISDIESGKQTAIMLHTVEKLARALGVPALSLLEEAPVPAKRKNTSRKAKGGK